MIVLIGVVVVLGLDEFFDGRTREDVRERPHSHRRTLKRTLIGNPTQHGKHC